MRYLNEDLNIILGRILPGTWFLGSQLSSGAGGLIIYSSYDS